MGDLLSGLPVGQIGAGALLGIGIILILTGKLVPLSVLRDALDQRDKALALAETQQKVCLELGMAQHQILDAVEKTTDIVIAIQAGLQAGTRPSNKGPTR